MSEPEPNESAPKRRRRGRGEGGVYQRQSDGLFVGTVELGWQDGKRKRRTVYGRTKDEVRRKVRKLIADRDSALPVQSKRRNVSDYLEQWLDDLPATVRPKTVRSYTYLTRGYLIPYLGKHTLETLTQHHVRQMMDAMQADGKSARTAALAKPPRLESDERPALSAEEARRLLAAVPERWRPLFTLAVTLGIRQSELLGLR